jgi:CheY-specific phosphatase CheX
MNNKAVFDELVTAATSELFQARGVAIRASDRLDHAMEYAATIGFASDQIRGMLGLGMDPDTLERLVAKENISAAPAMAEDWLAESVNQLLGRLKNKLLGYNLLVSLALPTVLRGVSLRFLSARPTSLWTYPFDSDAGSISVWLDVRHDAGLVLRRTDDPDMQGTPEGELLLF